MKALVESIRIALAALASNKLRAMLTTLGIVIGITTVLLMGWFISGLNSVVDETLSMFGDDVLYVDRFDWTSSNWLEQRNRKPISFAQFIAARERLTTAQYVIPATRRMARSIRYGDLELTNTVIVGSSADYVHTLGGSLDQGRFFSDVEDQGGAAVCVIGAAVADNLIPGGEPIGRSIRVNGLPFAVIGILPRRAVLGDNSQDNQIIVPIRRLFSMPGTTRSVIIIVKAGSADKLENLKYETVGVMRQVRSLSPGVKDDFGVNSQETFRQFIDAIRLSVFSVGIALTGLSFLVGSIGIMNIMFVSVTERTKEIGIRKALGATRGSILVQFLVESVALCGMGTVVATALTSIIVVIAKSALDLDFLTSTVPLTQIGVAVLVASVVGVLAGMIPALRAARLDPVEALRAE